MPFCKTCDQYESVHVKHECPPKWYAMDADEGDPEDIVDCPPFYAIDDEQAAIAYVNRTDDEGYCAQGHTIVVLVAPFSDPTQITKWDVTGELVREYDAEAHVEE